MAAESPKKTRLNLSQSSRARHKRLLFDAINANYHRLKTSDFGKEPNEGIPFSWKSLALLAVIRLKASGNHNTETSSLAPGHFDSYFSEQYGFDF
jgi:hypothetical protein